MSRGDLLFLNTSEWDIIKWVRVWDTYYPLVDFSDVQCLQTHSVLTLIPHPLCSFEWLSGSLPCSVWSVGMGRGRGRGRYKISLTKLQNQRRGAVEHRWPISMIYTVRIEIGKTCGAKGIGQITFFVSINILWSLKNVHIIIGRQNLEISKKSFFKSNLHKIC